MRFILGVLFASARIFGNYAPFGIGFAASCRAGAGGLFALLGTAVGSAAGAGFNHALKYIAIGVLVYAASSIFQDTFLYDSAWFAPANAALMTACTGFVYAANGGWSLAATAYYISEVVLAGGSAYFYSYALETFVNPFAARAVVSPLDKLEKEESTSRRRISVLISLATLFICLSPLRVFNVVSLGRVLAVIAVMISGFKGGMAWGCASGVAFGIAMDAQTGGEPFFTAAYALAGLISGVFRKHSRLAFVITYILANATAVLRSWDNPMREAALLEVFAASVVFFLLPGSLLTAWQERFLPSSDTVSNGSSYAARCAKLKAEEAAAAFNDVYAILHRNAEGGRNDNDIATVFDVAADTVCRNCRRQALCWQQNYNDTFTIMNDTVPKMTEHGELCAEDFPLRFRDKCPDLRNFISAVNTELRALLLRRQYRSRLKERQDTLFEQYRDMSAVLYSVAEAFPDSGAGERAANVENRIGKFLQSVNSDLKVSAFSDRNRRLHIELSGNGLRAFMKTDNWLRGLSEATECPLSFSGESSGALYLLETEPLLVSIGIASLRKRGEQISGDNGTFFKTDEGVLCVILSDGMGSGTEAYRDSQAAVQILERFLKAGVNAETALRVLSAVMTMRGEEQIGCATVDLLTVNLWNGHAELYKYGAAPSYVRKGSAVRRVSGDSLSAGINRGVPDRIRMYLEPGSFAVIVSDGVAGADDNWLSRYLAACEYGGKDFPKEFPNALARSIVETAAKEYGANDDMTAIVVSL
jgi:stage II sporulation protein E